MSFNQVMNRLDEGSSLAAAQLHERFVRRLIGLARKQLRQQIQSKVDPEDVVQSVFRSFFARQSTGDYYFDGWDSLWALLARITINKCAHTAIKLNAACRDVRRESVSMSDPRAGCLSIMAELDRSPTVEEAAILQETLSELMRSLNPQQRLMLQLKLQQHTNEEVAAQVACSERTVYRVLLKVRRCLERVETEALSQKEVSLTGMR